MPYALNQTHNPDAQSWIPSANAESTDFPLQNLPFGVFIPRAGAATLTDPGGFANADDADLDLSARIGVAIGNCVLDVLACHERGAFHGRAEQAADACAEPTLNAFMALGRPAWSALRAQLHELLRAGHADQRQHQAIVEPSLRLLRDVRMLKPVTIGNYSDFYASIHHATNMGTMLRPDSPLLPNYKHVPIGYHGRASSIVPSGTLVRRPWGQSKAPEQERPQFGPCQRLDYEVELGLLVGPGNAMGDMIGIEQAEDHIFGLCLVNDWSARDVQQWEYQPLGPFLSKSFATTMSPWIVTLEALEPFRVPAFVRADGDPEPLPYLSSETNRVRGGFGITIEAWLQSARMREQGTAPMRVSQSDARGLYWTFAQLLTHHASNGCNLQPGDLIASGTISGPEPKNRGCLVELTWRGTEPIALPNGETRRFLEDGDEMLLKAYATREGRPRIGFGECRGMVMPAAARIPPAPGPPSP
jgi:fumarylacetoacetase